MEQIFTTVMVFFGILCFIMAALLLVFFSRVYHTGYDKRFLEINF